MAPTSNYYDLPFIYVYDADALTDTQTYYGLVVPIVGDSDFILRRVAGLSTVAGTMMWRDAGRRPKVSAMAHLPNDFPVAPELLYPGDSQIGFDLGTVNRASWAYATPGSVPNYFSQLGFQGVRRYYGQQDPQPNYRYFNKPQVLSLTIPVTWTGRLAPAYAVKDGSQSFVCPVTNYDFELQKIVIHIQKNVGRSPGPWVVSQAAVKLTLYDAGRRALSQAPVVDFGLNSAESNGNSIFPVPTLLYPANSSIQVDVTSLLLNTEVPATLQIDFWGMWRFPC